MARTIGYRFWSKTVPVFYVESAKGRVGDWGYTTNIEKALSLTPYQQKRFAKDCKIVGVTAHFVTLED